SLWKAAGLGVLGALLFLGLAICGYFAYELVGGEEWGQKVAFGAGEEVYFTKNVTEAEARQLGRFLQEDGYFNGRNNATAQLAREGERIIVSFVVQRNAWNDAQIVASYRSIGEEISERLYGGRQVEVRLCDEELTVKKTIK